MDSWKRFNETESPEKESFYNQLNKEGITDEDYAHAQKVWKEFNITNFDYYYWLKILEKNAKKYMHLILYVF